MKQTYEQRVMALAEKMAKIQDPEHFKKGEYINNSVDAAFYAQETDYLISWYIESARMAIAEMAEQFDEGFQYGIEYDSESKEGPTLNQKLKEQGLIPDQEPSKESAFEKAIRETVERDTLNQYEQHEKIVGLVKVDRSGENMHEPEIKVTLACGYTARFFFTGLPDEEYVKGAEFIKSIERDRINALMNNGQEAGSDEN